MSLASNNGAVQVPSSVTVPAGSSSVGFSAITSSPASTETATLTASTGGVSDSYAVKVSPGTSSLSVSTGSIAFGNVDLNTTSTQSVTLKANGTSAVTVTGGTVSGTGFSISGLGFPLTLSAGQTATLDVQFDPKSAATETGTVTLTSNAASDKTATIALSGTGAQQAYSVKLNWDAPASSPQTITGYNVYREASGSSYTLLNSSPDASTSYTDDTVQSGKSYSYYVESVDSKGVTSTPSGTYSVTVP